MSGLLKQKEYDWKDSNMALFGSDVEKGVKGDAAKLEPAWKGAGQNVGLQIWRIVKFKVTHWPKEDYGKFFTGDSYIILNTYQPDPKSKELAYDLHFWIGSKSTQDEYGTAAYKTVELDTFLNDKPIQHREVQGYESQLFKNYFTKGILMMEGGAETGFKHVEPTQYVPRLLHVCGEKNKVLVKEVPRCKARLKSGDVFILDLGLTIYQWNGSGSNKDERYTAVIFLSQLKSERGKANTETLEEADTPQHHEFYDALTEEDAPVVNNEKESTVHQLYKVSDESGTLNFNKIKENNINIKDFKSDDVFILDTNKECYVWIGRRASAAKKKKVPTATLR